MPSSMCRTGSGKVSPSWCRTAAARSLSAKRKPAPPSDAASTSPSRTTAAYSPGRNPVRARAPRYDLVASDRAGLPTGGNVCKPYLRDSDGPGFARMMDAILDGRPFVEAGGGRLPQGYPRALATIRAGQRRTKMTAAISHRWLSPCSRRRNHEPGSCRHAGLMGRAEVDLRAYQTRQAPMSTLALP